MQVVTDSISFSPLHGSGPRSSFKDIAFGANVSQATVFLSGFTASFSHGNDHHLGNLNVQLTSSILSPNSVRVTATFGLRDWSGSWDDDYDGQIFFTVVAE
jgi:hypothetical protein